MKNDKRKKIKDKRFLLVEASEQACQKERRINPPKDTGGQAGTRQISNLPKTTFSPFDFYLFYLLPFYFVYSPCFLNTVSFNPCI
jgi:hypothetical protein